MPTDEALIHAWQQGDEHAFTALVQRHHGPLLAHLTRLTGERMLAEDLVQETFVRLLREGHTYRYPRPFLPWFYTIARHLARNHWQRAYVRHEESRQDLPDIADATLDPALWFERWEQHVRLAAALQHLSFEQREILSFRFGLEFSVATTAQILGLPPGTVKSRTFTALRRLQALLQTRDGASDPTQGVVQRG